MARARRPERCIVTVMAVDMAGSTRHIAGCDPEDAQAFLDRCFEHVRNTVEGAGGLLVDYEGDGGIAIFGWPNALENHADLACAAAWAMHEGHTLRSPAQAPVHFRVGLHTGLVSIRRVPREGGLRLNVVGAAVHLAAALQKHAAPDGVLLSADVLRLCRARLRITAAPAPPKAGELEQVFRLNAKPRDATQSEFVQRYNTPLIGRATERAALEAALPGAGSESASIAVVGEPGIGKSRLAAATLETAQSLGIRTLTFFGDARRRTTPFAAARALVLDTLPTDAEPGLADALAARGVAASTIAAVAALFTTAKRDRRRTQAAPTQTQIARALTDVFAASCGERPTVVLIEDLHVLDVESRQFLRLLARAKTPAPMLLLLTSRPESLRDCSTIAQRVLSLEPLPHEEMTVLARKLWTKAQPSEAILAQAVDRADGVPFVLEEMIRAIDPCDSRGFNPLPHSVESVIHARLNRLAPSAKAAAQALSLFGGEVDLAVAEAVTNSDRESLARDLRLLEQASFLHQRSSGAIRFRHQIIAEACFNTIPRERRMHLHANAHAALASSETHLLGRHQQLAFHAEGAGDLPAALEHLWRAGIEARDHSAAASLSSILDRALELIARIGPAADQKFIDFVLMASASMLQLGEFAKMNALLPRTMELSQQQGRPDKVCGTMSQLAMVCWFEGRYAEGLEVSERALAMAIDLDALPLIYSTKLMVTNNLHGLGLMHRAIAVQHELCDLLTGELATARLGAPSIPAATALAFLSWFMLETGQYGEALNAVDRALDIATREQDAYAEVLARSSMSKTLLALNRNADAVGCLTVAREIAERNGYDAIHANLSGRIAIALTRTGRAVEAVSIVEACIESGMHHRTGKIELFYLYAGYAEALYAAGSHTMAFAALDEAMAVARAAHNPCLIVEGLGLRGRLRRAGAHDDASSAARLNAYPSIEEDAKERRELCSRYGLVAWDPPAN